MHCKIIYIFKIKIMKECHNKCTLNQTYEILSG